MRVDYHSQASRVSTSQESHRSAATKLAAAIAGQAIPPGASAAVLKKLLDKPVDLESLALDDATWSIVRTYFEYSLMKERAVNGLQAYQALLAAANGPQKAAASAPEPNAPVVMAPARPKASDAMNRRAAYAFASTVLNRSTSATESADSLRAALRGKWVNLGDETFNMRDRDAASLILIRFEYAAVKERSLEASSVFDDLLGK